MILSFKHDAVKNSSVAISRHIIIIPCLRDLLARIHIHRWPNHKLLSRLRAFILLLSHGRVNRVNIAVLETFVACTSAVKSQCRAVCPSAIELDFSFCFLKKEKSKTAAQVSRAIPRDRNPEANGRCSSQRRRRKVSDRRLPTGCHVSSQLCLPVRR